MKFFAARGPRGGSRSDFIGKQAYLPIEHATAGTRLQLVYMNERLAVTVAGRAALFDPSNAQMKS